MFFLFLFVIERTWTYVLRELRPSVSRHAVWPLLREPLDYYPLAASLLVVVVAVVLLYVSLERLSNPLVTLGVLARPLHMRGYDVA
jgi:hypothetical protein